MFMNNLKIKYALKAANKPTALQRHNIDGTVFRIISNAK